MGDIDGDFKSIYTNIPTPRPEVRGWRKRLLLAMLHMENIPVYSRFIQVSVIHIIENG